MPTETITVRQAYEALAKNGFRHLREAWTKEDIEGVITGGCLLQQGALNLGVRNHDGNNSLYEQLNKYSSRNQHGAMEPLGRALVMWNDAKIYNYEKQKYRWVLPTYKAVIKKAYELMEPHFNKTLELEKREWAFKRKEDLVKV